ncbi:MAG: saccharopine dehydrogenase, partial [Chitinophagaceae bacterium]|nr:saccharopine dehydrogenase [Chitinophagaceae bacterium]
MKTILLFGAGKSATILIDYLIQQSQVNDWRLVIADENLELARSKSGGSPFALPV